LVPDSDCVTFLPCVCSIAPNGQVNTVAVLEGEASGLGVDDGTGAGWHTSGDLDDAALDPGIQVVIVVTVVARMRATHLHTVPTLNRLDCPDAGQDMRGTTENQRGIPVLIWVVAIRDGAHSP